MSKKHKNSHENSPVAKAGLHAAEYRIIHHDLLRVLYLNLIYLVGVLALFFSNQKTHYLERWFSQWFRF